MSIVLLGNVRMTARSCTNEVPDRIIVTERPNRYDFTETNLVAIFGNLEIRALVDSKCSPHVYGNRDLPLGGDFYYFHKYKSYYG